MGSIKWEFVEGQSICIYLYEANLCCSLLIYILLFAFNSISKFNSESKFFDWLTMMFVINFLNFNVWYYNSIIFYCLRRKIYRSASNDKTFHVKCKQHALSFGSQHNRCYCWGATSLPVIKHNTDNNWMALCRRVPAHNLHEHQLFSLDSVYYSRKVHILYATTRSCWFLVLTECCLNGRHKHWWWS